MLTRLRVLEACFSSLSTPPVVISPSEAANYARPLRDAELSHDWLDDAASSSSNTELVQFVGGALAQWSKEAKSLNEIQLQAKFGNSFFVQLLEKTQSELLAYDTHADNLLHSSAGDACRPDLSIGFPGSRRVGTSVEASVLTSRSTRSRSAAPSTSTGESNLPAFPVQPGKLVRLPRVALFVDFKVGEVRLSDAIQAFKYAMALFHKDPVRDRLFELFISPKNMYVFYFCRTSPSKTFYYCDFVFAGSAMSGERALVSFFSRAPFLDPSFFPHYALCKQTWLPLVAACLGHGQSGTVYSLSADDKINGAVFDCVLKAYKDVDGANDVLTHERSMLERLDGVDGVIQLDAGVDFPPLEPRHLLLTPLGFHEILEPMLASAIANLVTTVRNMHGRGVLHCDIRRENIVCVDAQRLVLVDFTAARRFDLASGRVRFEGGTISLSPTTLPDRLLSFFALDPLARPHDEAYFGVGDDLVCLVRTVATILFPLVGRSVQLAFQNPPFHVSRWAAVQSAWRDADLGDEWAQAEACACAGDYDAVAACLCDLARLCTSHVRW